MSIWAIVPVKPLRLAKSRLSGILTPEERQIFAEAMLRHVLTVISEVPQIMGTLVISRDSHALALARELGAKTVQESGTPELNAALMRATSIIGNWRSDAVLILPADLPLVQTEDIRNLVTYTEADDSIVIATDHHKDGTNALFIRPPGLIPYAYGTGSFSRHTSLAREAGAIVEVYESTNLLQDIDLPEDIENYYRTIEQNGYEDIFPEFLRYLDERGTHRQVE
ncbi:MAG: 2-phospho-L-lactate guanylyltransferase [Aggregatilineales bacterium]